MTLQEPNVTDTFYDWISLNLSIMEHSQNFIHTISHLL